MAVGSSAIASTEGSWIRAVFLQPISASLSDSHIGVGAGGAAETWAGGDADRLVPGVDAGGSAAELSIFPCGRAPVPVGAACCALSRLSWASSESELSALLE